MSPPNPHALITSHQNPPVTQRFRSSKHLYNLQQKKFTWLFCGNSSSHRLSKTSCSAPVSSGTPPPPPRRTPRCPAARTAAAGRPSIPWGACHGSSPSDRRCCLQRKRGHESSRVCAQIEHDSMPLQKRLLTLTDLNVFKLLTRFYHEHTSFY